MLLGVPFNIANKSRPKKVRPPYRKYVYKTSFTDEGGSDTEAESLAAKPNDHSVFDPKKLSIQSIYVLNKQTSFQGKVWPRSQFEKIDVLSCCLFLESEQYRLQLQQALELQATPRHPVLPLEIIAHIMEILSYRNELKVKFLLISKLLYLVAMPMLYRSPRLRGDNFYQFVETLNSKKLVGLHIRTLDLASVNQLGKNAFVAKLLKRSKASLQNFVAPQTSFGFSPLMALRSCHQLQSLDLRLVSETVQLKELFDSIHDLKLLTHLSFPRSSLEIEDFHDVEWPPKLRFLRISGGISDDFLIHSCFPNTIRQMELAHCPKVTHAGLEHLLVIFGRNLESLKVQFPMPGLNSNSLDEVFLLCPNLTTLEVCVDYLSSGFFERDILPMLPDRTLTNLYIDSSGMLGTTDRLDPIDLAVALSEDRLPSLKNVRVTAKLGWDPKSDEVDHIANELEERNGGLYIGY